jgi:hypothetical protein
MPGGESRCLGEVRGRTGGGQPPHGYGLRRMWRWLWGHALTVSIAGVWRNRSLALAAVSLRGLSRRWGGIEPLHKSLQVCSATTSPSNQRLWQQGAASPEASGTPLGSQRPVAAAV